MDAAAPRDIGNSRGQSLLLSKSASRKRRLAALAGQGVLLTAASGSVFAVLFIFYFIAKDAFPFFAKRGFAELFTHAAWRPAGYPPEFGALALFAGTGLVTLGAIVLAVPLGVCAAVCLSDILPFSLRQAVKPVIEILAAVPSVAYGFFALVVFAPALQERGGQLLGWTVWLAGVPAAGLVILVASDFAAARSRAAASVPGRVLIACALGGFAMAGLAVLSHRMSAVTIASGTNALNVSIVLGIMALPTVVSVSEDALQSVGRELREGAYALGSTRAEALLKVVIPAAASGIGAAAILGVMRAVGETMVVWMASGNAAQVPSPWFNVLQPVRTLTATIAGDMGEADQVMGSERYHVLFALAISLLAISPAVQLGERVDHPPRTETRIAKWVWRRDAFLTGSSRALGQFPSCFSAPRWEFCSCR